MSLEMYPNWVQYSTVFVFAIWGGVCIYAITDLSQSSDHIATWLPTILLYVGLILVFLIGHSYEKFMETS